MIEGTGGTLRNRWRPPPVQCTPPATKGPLCSAAPSRVGHAARCPHPALPHARIRRSCSAVILATYLMIVLDASVVITALPSIGERLDFSPAGLSWVQSAYALTFGGLLLLGARMGDILGRRRTFIAGIALFTVASFLGGLAQTEAWLLAARALQGVGAAIAAPSTLALLTTTFREGPERTRALAAYSAVAGGGGSVGLVLGGMLTDWISWRWGLWINVPVGVVLVWLAPRVLRRDRAAPRPLRPARRRRLDRRHDRARLRLRPRRRGRMGRRADRRVVRRGRRPARGLRRRRAARGAARHAAAAVRQPASGPGPTSPGCCWSAGCSRCSSSSASTCRACAASARCEAGIAFLPMTAVMFSMVRLVPRLSARWGDARLLVTGVSVALAGMAWLSRLDETTPFFPDIALPLVLLGARHGRRARAADRRGHRGRRRRGRRRGVGRRERRPAARRVARDERPRHGRRRRGAVGDARRPAWRSRRAARSSLTPSPPR